jgi:hypothetical protein
VIWLLVKDKKTHFFGWRSLYFGYLNSQLYSCMDKSNIYVKESKQLFLTGINNKFNRYFEKAKEDGWRLCIGGYPGSFKNIAKTLEISEIDTIVYTKIPDGRGGILYVPSYNGIMTLIENRIRRVFGGKINEIYTICLLARRRDVARLSGGISRLSNPGRIT